MNKVAVLGYGFLGASIVDGLSHTGHEVAVLNRSPVSHTPSRRIQFHIGDLDSRSSVEHVIKDALAVFAIGSTFPVLADNRLSAFLQQERDLIGSALRITADRGKRFVYLSSSAIYGEVPKGSACEMEAPAPLSAYGKHKASCEEFCLAEGQRLRVPVTILRLSNPFGPRQIGKRKQGLIGIALDNIKNDRPTTVRGNGLAVRDYFPVTVLSALISRLANDESGGVPDILNVCSGEGLSTMQVLDILSTWIGRDIPVEYSPLIAGEIQRSVLDPSRLRHFAPTLPDSSFVAGLEQFDLNKLGYHDVR